MVYAVHTGIGSLPIIFFGNKDQKKRYLPKIATGELITAYALTEPEAGSDALNAKPVAMLTPDGKYYILNGQKQFISNAGFADVFVTYAKVDGSKFTSFIVDRKFEGVSVDEEENKIGPFQERDHGAVVLDLDGTALGGLGLVEVGGPKRSALSH